MINFVLPTEKNKEDVLSFYKEFEDNNDSCIGWNYHDNYDAWLNDMINRRLARNLPKGWVRENFYLCYQNNELVGVFSLKFKLTDFLFNYGGHIGYAVRPENRSKGIATEILKEGLNLAKSENMSKVLLVCDEENIASEKVIVKNRGKFEDKRYDNDENVWVKRFWIEI